MVQSQDAYIPTMKVTHCHTHTLFIFFFFLTLKYTLISSLILIFSLFSLIFLLIILTLSFVFLSTGQISIFSFSQSSLTHMQDVLQARSATTEIKETTFIFQSNGESHKVHLLRAGGQRSQRRKWSHMFYCHDEIQGILFLVALPEYNLVLEEDDSTSRMHESLLLFEQVWCVRISERNES